MRDCCAIGLPVHGNYLVGLPGESERNAYDTLAQASRFLKEGILRSVDYGILVPYPGTELFRTPETFGLKIETLEWDAYREDSPPVYSTDHLTSERIWQIWCQGLEMLTEAYPE